MRGGESGWGGGGWLNTEGNFGAKFYGTERKLAGYTGGRVHLGGNCATMGKKSAALAGRQREARMESTNARDTGALIAEGLRELLAYARRELRRRTHTQRRRYLAALLLLLLAAGLGLWRSGLFLLRDLPVPGGGRGDPGL